MASATIIVGLVVVVLLLGSAITAVVFAALAFNKANQAGGGSASGGSTPLTLPPPLTGGTRETNPPGPTTTQPTVLNTTERWQLSQMLYSGLDETMNPCQDFYQFSCGGYVKAHKGTDSSTFGSITNGVLNVLTTNLAKPNNGSAGGWPTAVQQAVNAYSICMAPNNTFTNDLLYDIQYDFGGFPMVQPNWNPTNGKDPGEILGQLNTNFGFDSLISTMVDTNWTHPQKHMFIVSQASLSLPTIYYTIPALSTSVKAAVTGYMNKTAYEIGSWTKNALNAGQIASDVTDLYNFELYLAQKSLPVGKERDATKLLNKFTLSQASSLFPNIPFSSMIQTIVKNTGISPALFNVINVQEPTYFTALNAYLTPGNAVNGKKNDAALKRLIQNYLVYRLAHANADFIPAMYRYKRDLKRATHTMSDLDKAIDSAQMTASSCKLCNTCAGNLVLPYMPYAVGRLYVDFHFNQLPNTPREKLREMIRDVLSSFGTMINALQWMDPSTKNSANDKISNLVKNVGFPDWILNNDLLNTHYAGLSINPAKDQLWQVLQKLNSFTARFNYAQLSIPTIRSNFEGSPATVNAWYQPQRNSITFPAGILNPPFFSAGWPTANLFGAMGVVMGHELTHGFDDQGVQWGPKGALNPWIDAYSKAGFQTMAQCVIEEYNEFCYNGPAFSAQRCVSGIRTQGENIADNGGMKAAWTAYETISRLQTDPEPRLPGSMAKYSMDQLFFISFAHLWCETNAKESDIESQLLTDPHSPAKDRVWGTVKNLPAFQTAFNCPATLNGCPMNQRACLYKTCKVW